jgi:hypothetical protein
MVELEFIRDPQTEQDRNDHADRKTDDIQRCEDFDVDQVSQCDLEVIFKHVTKYFLYTILILPIHSFQIGDQEKCSAMSCWSTN